MSLLSEFAEFIRTLNEHRVRYLVIGGYAVAFHGHPRATDDVDVLIEASEANVRRVERALVVYVGSAPRPAALRQRGGMVRIGGAFAHIDITTKVDGAAADHGRLTRPAPRRVRADGRRRSRCGLGGVGMARCREDAPARLLLRIST